MKKIKLEYELAKRKRLILGLSTVVAGSNGNSSNINNSTHNNDFDDEDVIMENNTASPPVAVEKNVYKTPLLRAYRNRKLGINASNDDEHPIPPNSPLPGSPVVSSEEVCVGNNGNKAVKRRLSFSTAAKSMKKQSESSRTTVSLPEKEVDSDEVSDLETYIETDPDEDYSPTDDMLMEKNHYSRI